MLIGITGRGGTGKSTLAKRICEHNPDFVYIEVDKLIEQYVFSSSRLLNAVNGKFTDKEYTINDIVMTYFSHNEKEKKIFKMNLEEIERVLYERIDALGAKNYVIDWFLLHEFKTFKNMDIKILLTLERDKRIERVRTRNKGKDIDIFIEVDNFYRENYNGEFDYIFDTSDENYTQNMEVLCKKMSNK